MDEYLLLTVCVADNTALLYKDTPSLDRFACYPTLLSGATAGNLISSVVRVSSIVSGNV